MTRYLGIDPSIAAVGFAVLELEGLERHLVTVGTIRPKASLAIEERLELIGDRIGEVVRTLHPQFAAIEEVRFVNAGEQRLGRSTGVESAKTFLAAGVAFQACRAYGCAPRFVNPQAAKRAVLGPGGGKLLRRPTGAREIHQAKMYRKRLVRERLGRLLTTGALDCSLDASDAVSFAWLLTLEHGRRHVMSRAG